MPMPVPVAITRNRYDDHCGTRKKLTKKRIVSVPSINPVGIAMLVSECSVDDRFARIAESTIHDAAFT